MTYPLDSAGVCRVSFGHLVNMNRQMEDNHPESWLMIEIHAVGLLSDEKCCNRRKMFLKSMDGNPGGAEIFFGDGIMW